MAKTEVAVATGGAVALSDQYVAEAGAGFEETDSNSFAIPFLGILQSNSPQVKKSDGAYIKGAEEGMLFNSVTSEFYNGQEGIIVIPCHYTARYIEWKLRENGGGFVKEHMANDPAVTQTTRDDKGRNITSSGTQMVDTRNHYVLIVGKDGNLSPAVLTMASTQLRKSKQWMSMMQGIKIKNPTTGNFEIAPMYSRKYKLTTAAESNDKGSWFGYRVELHSLVDDPAEAAEAKAFHNAIRMGQARIERSTPAEAKEEAF